MKKDFIFLSQSIRNFHNTGAICSTSAKASQTLAQPVQELRFPKKILEVGAGTGPVTEQILKMMTPEDKLTACEINSSFMKILKKRLKSNSDYQKLKKNVELAECPIQDLEETDKFDVIICSLPFLNFNVEMVNEIFLKLQNLGTTDSIMTYYQYIGLSEVGMKLSTPKRKKRLKEINEYFKQNIKPKEFRKENVWLNISPITVYFLKPNQK